MLPLPLWWTRACGVVASGRETEHGNREAKARGGERPREDEAQESQGHRTWRNPATVRPNRQRDETPEARPLRQQCLKRRKRLAPSIREGRTLTGPFDELVL
jgi:hypothetical protein